MDALPQPSDSRVAAVRRFNRFYTRLVGALDEGHLRSQFSLAEVRVLYEIRHRDTATASDLGRDLRLDAGYLSRMISRLEQRGMMRRQPSATDGRQSVLSLTAEGVTIFDRLDSRAKAEVAGLLQPLSDDGQRRLLGAMDAIERILAPAQGAAEPYLLRPHQPGDMGWIVHRQAVLYHQEFGWDERYEALISRIVADFIEHFQPSRERCWVAERHGDTVGAVFVVGHPEREGVAKLRLLYVEPSSRGLGIGRRLVSEVTRFATQSGYHTLSLWTNSILVSARRIYEAEGYHLVSEESHNSFGRDLVGQHWELDLTTPIAVV
jgi:DNA-binding MarR family transcriptional regulator/GNAT superfamily N-acetyltransferase